MIITGLIRIITGLIRIKTRLSLIKTRLNLIKIDKKRIWSKYLEADDVGRDVLLRDRLHFIRPQKSDVRRGPEATTREIGKDGAEGIGGPARLGAGRLGSLGRLDHFSGNFRLVVDLSHRRHDRLENDKLLRFDLSFSRLA